MPTSATLFTGGGGADIGLEMAGFNSIWGIERDNKITQVAQLNLPHSNIINAAVEDVSPRSLPRPDLLWMSPPCQQYSNARRGVAADHQDKDAGLSCIGFITALKPQWIILENVPAYKDSMPFKQILKQLEIEGYRCHYLVLNAADHGVPQNRKRLILWASLNELPFFPIAQKRVGWYQAIAHLIPNLPDSKLADWQSRRLEEVREKLPGINLIDLGKNNTRTATVKPATEPSFTITTDHINSHAPVVLMPRAGASIQSVVPTPSDEPCPTIRAMPGRHTHWADVIDFRGATVKQITPEATALLQSFPSSYQLPESKSLAQKIIGNAVPPLLAMALGRAIIEFSLRG